jgi:adenylate kinase
MAAAGAGARSARRPARSRRSASSEGLYSRTGIRPYAPAAVADKDAVRIAAAWEDARMQPTIVLLGPPGSGKGTQAERLRERDGFTPLSTGELLRRARAEDSELGRRATPYMDRGGLVPDDLVVAAVRDAIARLDAEAILLDGFPRTLAQARALDAALAEHGRELEAAVLIDVPDETVVERIAGRGQGREDDRPETVRERLRVYHRDTEPLVAYYEERGLLRRVDGAGDADAVAGGIRDALG